MLSSSRQLLWAAVAIVAACLAAYHNTLSGPLLLDDPLSITDNPSIRSLWPLTDVLRPPAQSTVAGRPVANLSYALDYAIGGTSVRSYHVTNLALHTGAALLLFGVLRRAFSALGEGGEPGRAASPFAAQALPMGAALALIWAVHPLHTASVSYLSQRTEVLMGFWYLLSVYGFLRAKEGRGWAVLSVVACWCGMGSKEGMVTAPVVILGCDWLIHRESLGRILRRRWRYYAALAASWLLLGYLMLDLRQRAVGFGLGVSGWEYALTQAQAIVTYLRLVFWPHPLIFDYGALFFDGSARAIGYVILLSALLAVLAFVLWRRPQVGWAAALFLILLSPTSSVVPISAQPMAENRVYLASIPLLALAGVGAVRFGGRRTWIIAGIVAAGLVATTLARNAVMQDRLTLWLDTVAKRPENPRAWLNLGQVRFEQGQFGAARVAFERARQLKPDYPEVINNLGTTLHRLGDGAAAIQAFAEAVRLKPDFVAARGNLGNAYLQAGRLTEAEAQLRQAVQMAETPGRIVPELAELYNSLGNALIHQRRAREAAAAYAQAVELRPRYVEAQMNWGVALRMDGRLADAERQFAAAVREKPEFAEAHYNLGMAFLLQGRLEEARRSLEEARRLLPGFAPAQVALGDVALSQGRVADAHAFYGEALKANPNDSQLQQRWRQTAPAR